MKYNFIRFPGGKSKAVTLSYDDGACNDVQFLETVNKYGLKCTFNLVGKNVEKGEPLSAQFIKENMLAKGHEVATHGYNHRALSRVRSIEGIRDTLECRLALERALGIIVRGMAFPDVTVKRSIQPDLYETVREYLCDLDIAYVRSAGQDNNAFSIPDDWHQWIPTAHHDNSNVMEYIDEFLNMDVDKMYISRRDAKLFYLWGHSFEFERKNNWDHLEAICEKLGRKDDVWYATNIEIYNYVEAYRHLQYSADGTIVYNPTLYEIWFDIDKKLYRITPGETLRI